MSKVLWLSLLALLLTCRPSVAVGPFQVDDSTRNAEAWADSVFQTLDTKERIAQLMMVAAYSNKGQQHMNNTMRLIKDSGIGGLIFFQGTPQAQIRLTNTYQQSADVPLLIGMDAEWGLSMRLKNTMQFPRQMTLGAVQDYSLIRRMGQHIGRQCQRLGVHVNFAPVADVNNNPLNPVIHMRSFGEKPKRVAKGASAYLQGLQQAGVLGVAKHFPGHGDTDKDSHKSLPVLDHSSDRLKSTELVPFRKLIEQRVGGVMTGHLAVPRVTGNNRPASLSHSITHDLLQDAMGFDGLVFTDALNMKGITNQYGPAQACVSALKAGNDVLLYPQEVPAAINKIEIALHNGTIDSGALAKRVKKVLTAKYWLGLSKPSAIASQGLQADLHKPEAADVKQQLIEGAMTLVKDSKDLIPFTNLANTKVAALAVGGPRSNAFQKRLNQYDQVKPFHLEHRANEQRFQRLRSRLSKQDVVIVSLHGLNNYRTQDFGLSETLIKRINTISSDNQAIIVNFSSPYALRLFKGAEGVLQAYEDGRAFQQVAAQALFGGFAIQGELPVSVDDRFQAGRGLQTEKAIRLNYTLPERVGVQSEFLKAHVDSIAKEAIQHQATPGCQVFIAKEGNVIYNKAFGSFTYADTQPAAPSSIYDIASVTKIGATVPTLMRLYEQGRVNLNDSLGQYLVQYLDSVKQDLKLRELLTHQAGLEAWIPFYRYTLNERGFCDSNYCYDPNSFFSLHVADNLYLQEGYRDSIWRMISDSEIEKRGSYNYSDLGFFYLKKVIEQFLEVPFEAYVRHHFHEPLGMDETVFRPAEKFSLSRIVPTELDQEFRHQLIHGYVHDPAAAMLGGVAGHAGLFSNVNDFAKYMQMLLNGGKYGGRRFFDSSTVALFTTKQYKDNRKGLGFDKPEPDPEKISPTGDLASFQTFGHTGFTGTCVWADPKHDLIYGFFSNRVHPDANNTKLIKNDYRTRIQDQIYRSFLDQKAIDKRDAMQ